MHACSRLHILLKSLQNLAYGLARDTAPLHSPLPAPEPKVVPVSASAWAEFNAEPQDVAQASDSRCAREDDPRSAVVCAALLRIMPIPSCRFVTVPPARGARGNSHGTARGSGGGICSDGGIRSSISKTDQIRQDQHVGSSGRRAPSSAIATTAVHLKGSALLDRGGGGGGSAGLRELQVHSHQQPHKLQQLAAPSIPSVLKSKWGDFVEQGQPVQPPPPPQQQQFRQHQQSQHQQSSSKWEAFVHQPRVPTATNFDDDDDGFATCLD